MIASILILAIHTGHMDMRSSAFLETYDFNSE